MKPLKKPRGLRRQVKARTSPLNLTADQLQRQLRQHKLFEDTLRRSEKKYRTLLENLPQKIFHKDSHSVYISCNKNYADDLKIRPDEITGKTDYDFYPRKLAEKYRADDNEVMKRGVVKTIEERYVKDGEKMIVHTVKVPIKDKREKAIGILGIFWDITERKKMEHKVAAYQKDLKALALQLTSVEEHERKNLATFLHDNIGQSLSILKIQLALFAKSVSSEQSKEEMQKILTHIDQLIQDTRSLTYELSPAVLYQLGLGAGLEYLVEQVKQQSGIMIHFKDDKRPKSLDNDTSIFLYRSVHELLINVLKYAKAHNVNVSFERSNDHALISVVDDGVGFAPSKGYAFKNPGSKGIGLFSIRERLNQLGGKFAIVSKLNHGTRVSLMLPLNKNKKTRLERTS
jgi:PAS domain S-box-containing protein